MPHATDRRLVFGLATWTAIVTMFEPARIPSGSTHPEDIALDAARIAFLDSATVTAWKAYVPMPADRTARELLAEELESLGSTPGLCDFEFATNRPNQMVRGAFLRAAAELRA